MFFGLFDIVVFFVILTCVVLPAFAWWATGKIEELLIR